MARDFGPDKVEFRGKGKGYYDDVENNPIPLNALLSSRGRRHLLHFFLDKADREHRYSKKEIAEECQMSRQTVVDNIDDFVEFGIIEAHGEKRPRYTVADDSEVFVALHHINRVLYKAYMADDMDQILNWATDEADETGESDDN